MINARCRSGATGRRAAFTLVELLVVIAILAILVALLFPVFARAREKGRQAACISNLKHIGTALLNYSQDFDEAFPCGTEPLGVGKSSGLGWAGQSLPYVGSSRMLACLDDPTIATGANSVVSYAYNVNIGTNDLTAAVNGSAIPKLSAPSRTVLLCEVSGVVANVGKSDEGRSSGATLYSPTTEGVNVRAGSNTGALTTGYLAGVSNGGAAGGLHTGAADYLLADGHVHLIRPETVCPGGQAASETAPYTLGATPVAAGTSNGAWTATFSGI